MSGWGTIYNNTRYALQLHAQRMADLQEQAASGARINRASDDPSDAYRVIRLRAQAESMSQFGQNLDDVVRTLELGHSVLEDISGTVSLALQKLEQAASGTYDENSRAILGQEINNLLEQTVALVNTSSLGRYLFGGSRTAAQPYAVETNGGRITAVRYQGAQEDLTVPVAPGVDMAAVGVGDRMFRVDSRQASQILGNTGAAAGSGTASMRGDGFLDITHKATVIMADPDNSGLAVSIDPAFTDTALGDFNLVVDVAAKTIGFQGGPTCSFTGTETSLEVRNADGGVVYVDVTGLNGALASPATVSLKSTAWLSIDGKATPTELTDFGDTNLAVYDSQGRVLYVDATNIHQTGTDVVRNGGTHDLFSALIEARDILLNVRGDLPVGRTEMIQNSINAMKGVLSAVTQSLTSMGGRLEALDTLDQTISTLQTSASDQAAQIEEADIVQVAADLARTQTLYEMTLVTASKLLSLSLLDYI